MAKHERSRYPFIRKAFEELSFVVYRDEDNEFRDVQKNSQQLPKPSDFYGYIGGDDTRYNRGKAFLLEIKEAYLITEAMSPKWIWKELTEYQQASIARINKNGGFGIVGIYCQADEKMYYFRVFGQEPEQFLPICQHKLKEPMSIEPWRAAKILHYDEEAFRKKYQS